MSVRLYDYPRSSACYRVRIALNLKQIAYQAVPVSLIDGDQRDPAYVAQNPQGLVPMLEIDGQRLTQSLAIMDYLDATRPDPPFMPRDPFARSLILAMALTIACDIHPLNNLRVLKYLGGPLDVAESARDDWYRHWIHTGFSALEAMAVTHGAQDFLGGTAPGFADICLVPQMANARRFSVDLSACPVLVRIDAACTARPAFAAAHPDVVADTMK